MKEIWKDVIGYEGIYQISNLGKIKTKKRMLKPYRNTNGYYQIFLYKNGKRKPYTIHKLVMLTFVGERPSDMEVRHLNSNKLDNRLCNLVYGTRSENMIDAGMLGHLGRQKLMIDDVENIRQKIFNGERVKDIAEEYSVCIRTISDIKNHHTYVWL